MAMHRLRKGREVKSQLRTSSQMDDLETLIKSRMDSIVGIDSEVIITRNAKGHIIRFELVEPSEDLERTTDETELLGEHVVDEVVYDVEEYEEYDDECVSGSENEEHEQLEQLEQLASNTVSNDENIMLDDDGDIDEIEQQLVEVKEYRGANSKYDSSIETTSFIAEAVLSQEIANFNLEITKQVNIILDYFVTRSESMGCDPVSLSLRGVHGIPRSLI